MGCLSRSIWSSIFLVTLFWIDSVFGVTNQEVCEDDTVANKYCPLRPGSSSALNQDLSQAFDVCEADILPICVTAPRRKKTLMVTTIRPATKNTKAPVTTTNITTTTTPPSPSGAERCEDTEDRSLCDTSTTWLTSKMAIDIKSIPISFSTSSIPTSTTTPVLIAITTSRTDEGRQECEESRSPCELSTTWLKSTTVVDIKSLTLSRTTSTTPPIMSVATTTSTDDEGREECEESRNLCDVSRTWLKSRTVLDIKLLTTSRDREPPSPTTPSLESEEGQECEETRSRCDMSMIWLTSKTTVDLKAIIRSTSTPAPISPPPLAQNTEGQSCEEQDTNFNSCDTSILWVSSKTTIDRRLIRIQEAETEHPVTVTEAESSSSSTEHSTRRGAGLKSNLVEIQDIFKNMPLSIPQSRTLARDQYHRLIQSPWKSRMTLADVWKAERQFATLAKNYRTNLVKQDGGHVAAQQGNDYRRMRGRHRTLTPSGLEIEWDYFHPMVM